MAYIVIMIIIIAIVVSRIVKSPNFIGERGEAKVANQLMHLGNKKFKVLNNLLLEHNGNISQIDHVVVSVFGIFVIETKNYSGWIFGDDKSEYWTQVIYGSKRRFRNPVKQNWSHVYFLQGILANRKHIKYFPIVAFTGSAELKSIKTDCLVTYKELLYQNVLDRCNDICMSDNEVNEVCELIKSYGIEDTKQNRHFHIQQISNNVIEREIKKQSMICPQCGMKLVHRSGPYGDFIGCSGFPKCKYTMKQ
jgi:hypothetical protein